jgi:hypothetical protein
VGNRSRAADGNRRLTAAAVKLSSTKEGEILSGRTRIAAARQKIAQEIGVSEARTDSSLQTTEVEVLDAKERWSEYRLADGTTMRVKSVVIAVFREDDQQSPDGEPVYSMKSTLITDVRTPALSPKPPSPP